MNRWMLLTAVLVAVFTGAASAEENAVLQWSALPPLPDPVGYAGSFAGVSGEALIVAGGANFPDAPPWEGGTKQWHAASYVLPRPEGKWLTAAPLPRPLGYGVSITWGNRLFCLGGGDGGRHYADVFALRWDGESLQVERDVLPKLPRPCAFGAGVVVDNVIYLAGGIDRPDAAQALQQFWALDLSRPPQQRRWQKLPPWPGPGRILPVMGTVAGEVVLVSGAELSRDASGDVARRYLKDAYAFDPQAGSWRRLADAPRPLAGAPSPAFGLGSAHLAFLGGDDGEKAESRERRAESQAALTRSTTRAGGLGSPPSATSSPLFNAGSPATSATGFRSEILLYHAITDTWRAAGAFSRQPPVTTPAVVWRGRYVVPGGEIRPGVRTPNVLWAAPAKRAAGAFGWLNWSVLVIYFGAMVGIGWFFSGGENSTDDFFLGGRRVPWWAAGLSIFGTMLSAITYLSIPARAYATDWSLILMSVGILVVAPIVVYLYLPFFRRLQLTTAFEYLEQRFHLGLRLFGSASFVAFQLGRMSIVILLPAMAISAVVGLDIRLCILLMGLLSTLYTVMGGIEAVIWTDVVQVVVLLFGAMAAILAVVLELEGGLPEMLRIAAEHGKFTVAHLSWSWTGDALWIVVLGALFSNGLVPYTADQAVIQRYLTTPDERQAARAIWTNALLTIPATLLFFLLGAALFAFYHAHPGELRPLDSVDQILPWFIATQLPTGVAGLVIAGVFAASMSSLDSSMHSISTALTTDFVRRFHRAGTDELYLKLARLFTVLLGALGTAAALWLARMEVPYLWDLFLGIMGLLGGTLAGLFLAGIFLPRVGSTHAWLGVAASLAALLAAKFYTDASALLYGAIGVASCVLVAWLASLILPASANSANLTVFSMPPRDPLPPTPGEAQADSTAISPVNHP